MRRKEDWIPPYNNLDCLNSLTEEQKQQVLEVFKKRNPFLGPTDTTDQNQVVDKIIAIAKELGFLQ